MSEGSRGDRASEGAVRASENGAVPETREDPVPVAREGAVLWLTLNRPGTLNAVTAGMRELLIAELDAASADPGIRAVVLTGAGRGFCSGADLRPAGGGAAGGGGSGGGAGTSRAARVGAGPEGGAPVAGNGSAGAGGAERVSGDVARVLRRGVQRMITAVLDCEKPVLAAVNGTAAGVGVHLALACDLVLAAEGASFVEAFVRRGLVPDGGGAYLLPRLVGPQRAKELMFFGDALSAADAERLGLVNRVVPAEELVKTAREWAERLAAGPTRALALTKQLVNASLEADRAAALAAEATAQELNMTTTDAQEGVRAFVERRAPHFTGR